MCKFTIIVGADRDLGSVQARFGIEIDRLVKSPPKQTPLATKTFGQHALKRWAILICPSGMKTYISRFLKRCSRSRCARSGTHEFCSFATDYFGQIFTPATSMSSTALGGPATMEALSRSRLISKLASASLARTRSEPTRSDLP